MNYSWQKLFAERKMTAIFFIFYSISKIIKQKVVGNGWGNCMFAAG
jgi:hypothetical protein